MMKILNASLISAKMLRKAAHPSSLVLPAGMMIVLRFLLMEASDTWNIISTLQPKTNEAKINGHPKLYLKFDLLINRIFNTKKNNYFNVTPP